MDDPVRSIRKDEPTPAGAGPPPIQPKPLKHEFADSLRSAVETQERVQLMAALRDAKTFVLESPLARTVHEVLDIEPHSVESNLDLLVLPHAPATWIEIDDRDRRPPAAAGILPEGSARVGYLITPHPADPNILVAAVARQVPERGAGTCHLLPSLIAINIGSLSEASDGARRFFSKQRDESLARMMMGLHTYIPAGFVPEFEVMERMVKDFSPEEEGMKARLDATGEGIFLLGVLLALRAPQTVLTVQGKRTSVGLRTPAPEGWTGRAGRLLGARRRTGFVRRTSGGTPSVDLIRDGCG